MPPTFSELFRHNGRDPSAEPAGNEDLECGHRSLVLQTPTASGYQSSPSRVYLPETQKVLTSTVPRTLTPSREYFSHVRYNGQHGSTAQLPLTPSGPSRVIGFLPRTTCNDSSLFVGSTRPIVPSQPPQNACDEECMSNSAPQCRSTSISRTASYGSLSPMSPFDPWKHGHALGRLEAHGSLKTVPSSQQEGGTLNGTSVSWSEIRRRGCVEVEEHAGALRDSHIRQPESGSSADLYGTSDQQSGIDVSLPPIQYLPTTVYQPVVLIRGDPSKFANRPYAPKAEDGQSFREALPSLKYTSPNAEANNSSQATQQALHRSQVLPKPYQVLSPRSTRGETIIVDASPELRSKSPSSRGTSENDTVENLARFYSTGTETSEKRRLMRNLIPEHARQAQSPMFEETDEYLWSPAPSDDAWEAPSAPHTPIPCHTPSDALSTSFTSGLASDSRGGLSRSRSHVNEHLHSLSGSPGKPGIVDSSLPHIDALVPAGEHDLDSRSDSFSSSQHAPMMGSRKSSRILFRYSRIITNGASSRSMSENKLKKGVLPSLGDRDKTASSMPSSMNPGGQTGRCTNPEQIPEEYVPNVGSEAFSLDPVQNPSADAGPGSSQTSSSLSTDRFGGDLSGHKARSQLPTTRARCHTPPLLFGKVAISGPENFSIMSSNAPGSTMGRFDQNPRPTRLKETDREAKALYCLDEQDWETVSAETEARRHALDSVTFDTKTGSSLADNSDSGNLSLSKDMPHPFRSIKAHPVMQHPAHPRHNYSFMILKNSQTGDLVQVPQYEYASGSCLPNNNASSQLGSRILENSTYHHPSPLQVEHTHPFSSSSPIIRFAKPSAISGEKDCVMVQQSHLKTELSNLRASEDVQGKKERQTHNPIYKTTQDVLHIPTPVVNQGQHIMEYKELSPQSSPWFSTVSEVTSSEPSLPEDYLPTTKVLHGRRHSNGTLEQRVDQEVGSSLADADSPGINLLSSPVSLASSFIHVSDASTSLKRRLCKQAVQQDSVFDSQHTSADFHISLVGSLNHEDLAISTYDAGTHSRSYSAGGLRLQYRKPSLRRSRSSSESHSRLMDSPSAQKASAMKVSSSDSDAQHIASSGLLLRNPLLHSDGNNSQYNHGQQNVIERRSHQPKAGDVSIDDPSTPSSTGSRPFMREGFLQTGVSAPILHHPVYGRKGPWDRITPDPLRPRPQPEPLGHPLFQRPVARAESPHLHRIQHSPTTELVERHVLLSRVYLLPSMVVPPIALVYGHGYMDGLMRLHTMGEINGFRTTEKIIALCWGYGSSAICILAVVIVMIIIPASA